MRLLNALPLLGLAALLAGAGVPGPANPVLDVDFPDPMVLRAPDGWYYAYATGSFDGKRRTNLSVSRSKDLKHWSVPAEALPVKPKWARTKGKFWAPHVVAMGGKYVMYYSAEPDWSESEHMRLAIATAQSPLGPFMDLGKEMDTGDAEENLDPAVLATGGKRYLYWGRNGVIAVQELASDGLSFARGSAPRDVLFSSKRPYENIVEGPFVVERHGWFFMFYSGDDCCGNPPHYAVMVARAKSPLGPFTKKADGVILAAGPRFLGPGHNAVLTDTAGRDHLVYHAVDARQPKIPATGNIRRPLMTDPLSYTTGWPQLKSH